MNKPALFNVQLVGLEEAISQRNGRYTIKPDVLVKDVKKTDLIIVPAMFGEPGEALKQNEAFIPWVVQQYKSGAELASFCIGAFFLAATGLLNGKKCSTHWTAANDFRTMFPDVMLMDDKILTEDEGIYTSGGAYSYTNLLLYLIEKYGGRDLAILVAKAFLIDIDRTRQSPFIIFQGQKIHDDEPIKKAQEFIEKNFHDKITVDQLASMFALSRRNLERRFKKATSNTVVEYMQRVKVEAAKMSLETSRMNVNEVMYNVGYTDTKAFRSIFNRITGLSPVQYRNKYNREMAVA